MKNTKVIDLGPVRNLLAEWEKVRQHIIAGTVDGWAATIRDVNGAEAIYLGGIYREDKGLALSAGLRMSAAQMLQDDAPPARVAGMA